MKINILTLRFTLMVILLRFIVGLADAFVISRYFYEVHFGIDIQTALSIFFMLIEIYLLYYLLIFLNQIASFKKVNLFLWILIITSILQIIFSHIMDSELKQRGWATTFMVVWGISYTIARIGLIIRLFSYRGIFRKDLMYYAFAEITPLIFQIVLVPLTIFLRNMEVSYFTYISNFLFYLPSLTLFILFYKALKHSNFQEEKGSSSALDGGEFSNY
jgi:hypothetical protein